MSEPFLHNYLFSARMRAFSTTRQGGVSKGRYASFNINPYCGDNAADVSANRALLAGALGISTECIVLPHQTHGTASAVITPQFFTLSPQARQQQLEGIDALLTDMHDVCIGVSTADCIPVLLYDEEHHATAAIHAGWRGTVARIVQHTASRMQQLYGTDMSLLRAVIGPGISLESFEVGDEVYAAFASAHFDMNLLARRYPAMHPAGATQQKWHINLPLCNQLQLEQLGVPGCNIFQSDICTYAHDDTFFSARRLGADSGRIYTGIMLMKG